VRGKPFAHAFLDALVLNVLDGGWRCREVVMHYEPGAVTRRIIARFDRDVSPTSFATRFMTCDLDEIVYQANDEGTARALSRAAQEALT
jgi:hypothetical protein